MKIYADFIHMNQLNMHLILYAKKHKAHLVKIELGLPLIPTVVFILFHFTRGS